MDKLLLVDGSNLLFQMFYGMPARIVNRQGRAIHGTLGFVGALLKMIQMTHPSHIAVLFDGEYVSERTQIDESYKGNRTDYSAMPEEETPFSQLPDIYAALDHLGIRHQESTVCEVDDWIAGYAKKYAEETDIIISSQDSDFFQLITDRVRILRYRGKNTVICDREYITEKLGIRPEQYASFKALTGDTSDNIRGVPGIGPKTAAMLMGQFGDLENLLANFDQVRKTSVRASVKANLDRIRQNDLLIRLKGPRELPFALEELIYQHSGVTTGEVLEKIGLKP